MDYFGKNPFPEEKPHLYGFLYKVLQTIKSQKVANLDSTELYQIRVLENVSVYANVKNHSIVSEFLRNRSEVILGTSLSKKGFLIEKSVTQKKETQFRTGSSERGDKKWWNNKQQED